MTTLHPIDDEYAILLSHPFVQSTDLVKRRATRLDGYLRARCILQNGDFLEIAIHIKIENGKAEIDEYRYQWMDASRQTLRRRWDNSPHFPNLSNFPHHCHVEKEDAVEPAVPMDISTLLTLIEQLANRPHSPTHTTT